MVWAVDWHMERNFLGIYQLNGYVDVNIGICPNLEVTSLQAVLHISQHTVAQLRIAILFIATIVIVIVIVVIGVIVIVIGITSCVNPMNTQVIEDGGEVCELQFDIVRVVASDIPERNQIDQLCG